LTARPDRPNATELICGVHAVEEALAGGERVRRIVTTRSRLSDRRVRALVERARAMGVVADVESDGWFARLGAARHQHVAAIVDGFSYAPWPVVRALARSSADAMLVALDHIEDPQNVGAILRNAEGAGVSAAILPDRRSAGISAAARRASAGAASHVRIACVPNLVRALDDLKADGCWITGLAAAPQARPYASADLTGKRVFVVGSEGKGLQRLVAEHCDELVRIPLLGSIASLNAASAAAVVLFEAVRQRQNAHPALRPDERKNPTKS
jgi:23S rRNA (guanosine2251-2'-O)-methyltransferase